MEDLQLSEYDAVNLDLIFLTAIFIDYTYADLLSITCYFHYLRVKENIKNLMLKHYLIIFLRVYSNFLSKNSVVVCNIKFEYYKWV